MYSNHDKLFHGTVTIVWLQPAFLYSTEKLEHGSMTLTGNVFHFPHKT